MISAQDPSGLSPTEKRESAPLCLYINVTSHVEVIKITGLQRSYWEKVVFPGQRVLFTAHQTEKLEVYSGEDIHNLLREFIPCEKLQIQES